VIASDVSSRTADVGDKISLTLAEDLKAGDAVVVKKGTPAVATVTEVDGKAMAGTPGEVFFQVDSLQAGSVLIKLHGTAAKEGQDKAGKAMGLMLSRWFRWVFSSMARTQKSSRARPSPHSSMRTHCSRPQIRAGDSVRRRGQDCRDDSRCCAVSASADRLPG